MLRQAPLPLAISLLFLLTTPTNGQRTVIAPEGTDVGLPFSPGVLSEDFLFLSGAIGNDPGTTQVTGDAAAQTRKTLENLKVVLAAADMDFSNVVEANVFLADSRHFQAMGEVYGEYLGDVKPTRATVEADIAIPGSLTEIAMVAARPGVKVRRISPQGWPDTGGAYSWGMLAGDTLFIAGMVSTDPAKGEVVTGDVTTQANQVMKNVGSVLAAANMEYQDLVACNIFLADPRDYDAMNKAYGSYFEGGAAPARATVRARMVNPALTIEIQCRGVRGGGNKVVAPAGYKPSGRPLSPAVQAKNRLYLSGMVGRGSDGYPDGVEAQTRVCLDRLKATLTAAGMTFDDVEMASVFLTDIRHYPIMNRVYREMVGSPPPARATVGSQLMSPDALVEIQMIAHRSPAASQEDTGAR